MRLCRYLSFMLLRLAVTAALILAFIAEVLDLVENAGEVLGGGDGIGGILRYVALKMPTLLTHSLPLGALVGGLLTLLLLARNSEIVAMRAAGLSTWRLYLMMVPGAILITVLQSTLLDVVAPRTEAQLSIMMTKQIENAQNKAEAGQLKPVEPKPKPGEPGRPKGDKDDDDGPKPLWLRIGDSVVSFERVSDKGKKLRLVRIYERDANKQVTARIVAGEAKYDKRKWTLKDAERTTWTRDAFNVRTPVDGPWETTLTPDDVVSALTPEMRVSLSAARAVLAGRMTPNAPLPFYETLIERVYAAPLAAIVMVLLAMPAALVNWRDPRTSRHGAVALGTGLFFMLTDGLLSTLALTGVISPVMGAWSALFIFAAWGAWRIVRIDRGWGAPGVVNPPAAGSRTVGASA